MSFITESFGVCWPCALYVMLFLICISGSPSSSIFFINADLQVGNSFECYHIVVSHPGEKLLCGPDVLTAMGSFPLPPCTDVHQVLIPRSHTRTSNICTHCTTRHNHTQIQIDISAPKHGHDYVERVPWVHITLLLVDIWLHSEGITRDY